MPDRHFADPKLAAIYDDIDSDRSDLAPYEALLDQLGATSVTDVGCGTGELACRLAAKGLAARRRSNSAGPVDHSTEVTDVALPLVSFRHTYRFVETGVVLTSDSTLRFRDRDEIEQTVAAAGFEVVDVRDAPDRPGREFVFVAQALAD